VANSNRVYVGNLAYSVQWQQLKDHFRSAGQVVHADVFMAGGRSRGCGVVEFVKGCVPASEFTWSGIESLDADKLSTFIRSAAGSFIASWVMGIKDRHEDNMMIKDNHIFFHIDFGWLLGEGPFIDAPIFSIPNGMKKYLPSNLWSEFIKLCCEAFAVLHRNGGLIINLASRLFRDVIEESKVRKYLVKSLMIVSSEEEATKRIQQLIESGLNSIEKHMKNLAHNIAQNRFSKVDKSNILLQNKKDKDKKGKKKSRKGSNALN